MTTEELLLRVTEIMRDVFEDPALVIRPEMTADDIAGWDSLSQVTLAVEIRHRLGVKIKSAEMEEIRDIRHLVEVIGARLDVTMPGAPRRVLV